jgi:hypothetical protein
MADEPEWFKPHRPPTQVRPPADAGRGFTGMR